MTEEHPRHPRAATYVRLFAGVTGFKELERRIAGLPTEQERGAAFEVFAEAYFATQPIEKARHVWPDTRIPESFRRQLRLHSRDVGVDGLIETNSGTLRAYQVKFRTGRPALRWEETATFFGLTDRCRERVLFTNCDDLSAVMDERRDFSSIRGCDLDRLEPTDFQAIRDWLRGAKVVHKRKQPRPHQTKALRAIIPALRRQDRVTAVMACGTGKTQVALWTAEALVCGGLTPPFLPGGSTPERNNAKQQQSADKSSQREAGTQSAHSKVLVLVPSLALLRQTLKEWVNQTKWPHFDYLCVCSDPTVSRGEDELVIRPTELEFSVSTEPRQVRQFLQRPFHGVKIIFSTYQSAEVVAKGMRRGDAFDLAIFDEAHKTAGRDGTQFSFALKDQNLSIRKRLFLTATPRHYNLQKRDQEGDPVEVFSMNRPDIYGPVVHTLTFAEAARQGIICNYKVIISVVTSKELTQQQLRHGQVPVKRDRVKAAQVANQLALAQAVRRHPIRKIFTFHRTVDSAASFTAAGAEGIQNHLPQFGAFHVRGSMPSATRERVMDEFRAAPKALMSNARCLTEGIDCPAVDMVAFLTPKRSRVDIVQATGRAMRRDPANKAKLTGYIFVPLYVEQAKGESLEAAIERTEFDEVWAVLQAMQEQDDVLDDRIHYVLATGKKTKGFNDAIIRQRVEVTGPAVALDKLRRAIAVKCLDRIGRRWATMVQQLLLFKKRYGHYRVPKNVRYPWRTLGLWVDEIRADKRNGKLSPEREVELTAIGFEWRVDGQTLDDTTGLLVEADFRKVANLSVVEDYRERGLIKPVGRGMSNRGLSWYYHPCQITQLRKKLGITLDSTVGLLNEQEFATKSGLSSISRYRKQGKIKPIGWALTSAGLSAFYHSKQIKQLKANLGITLDRTEGLLSEEQFKAKSKLWATNRYRKIGLIKPVGWAITTAGISAFYLPQQIRTLKNRLGITLDNTTGLLTEKAFAKRYGFASVRQYRRRRIIKPAGWAMTYSGLSRFYHPMEIRKLHKKLGVTLEKTRGLLSERQFRNLSGFSRVARYRERGIIKPVGWAITNGGLSAFYHPRQAREFRKRMGITHTNTTGLLSEQQFMERSGLWAIVKYRKRGLIKPAGKAMTTAGVRWFYKPQQIIELKKRLGVTLNDTAGLLSENQFKMQPGCRNIVPLYRKNGLLKPVGWAVSPAGITAFYHPRQVKHLRKQRGITLEHTKGLLNEKAFTQRSGLTRIYKYRQQGLIKPMGFGLSNAGVSAFYHPHQVKELKTKLGITLESTNGLLNETQCMHISGLSKIADYRRKGLITPIGRALAATHISYFYHPRQIKELKAKLKALKRQV
jgi:superfamily II DNA or RNA helicase